MIVLALTLHFSSQSLEASTRQRLMLICDMKAAQLEEYIGERRSDARVPVGRARVRRGAHEPRRADRSGKRTTDEYSEAVKKLPGRLGDYVEAARSRI